MTSATLPNRATTAQTCQWLSEKTGAPWDLARLLEHGLTPYVWLEYAADYAELFAEGITAYAAPVVFIEDTQRLAAGSEDVLLRFTRDSDRLAIQLKAPGLRRPLEDLRFFQRDVAKLAEEVLNPKEVAPVQVAAPMESQKGISKEQILGAFGGIVKLDLEKALAGGQGIFGDDGARVRKNSRAGKNSHLWNPVTLAFGLHDVHRVPMSHLKKAFATQPVLREWKEAWLESLALLGE
ncbi:hypothetical protein [Janthinobacterium sp.]|uniref:hypothetical protein n=1 Tax=Janthinobacterium sp. TaxID=1871054 RepID=UPI00293D2CE8|nr:hypothetical protein [Janthinobacterium sp.]